MKHLPTGRQNFKDIRQNDLVYVDKTQQIHQLVERGSLYFLSRPRRFGKSLLLSKFNYLFSGEKQLFEGLYVSEQTDYDFESFPILHFNFSSFGHRVEDVEAVLHRKVIDYADQFEVEIEKTTLSEDFTELVVSIAAKSKPVVILIDEYDKPIIDFLTQPEKAKANQKVLRDFFSPLKALELEGHLRFLFITGVSKFSKVSLFSDLNNLIDLSLHPWSDDLLGITQEELLAYFPEHIEQAQQKLKMTQEELLKNVKTWYNGYAYNPDIKLYNPFSLLNFFQTYRFGNFWFATGTPTFLVETIRNQAVEPQTLEAIVVPETFFDKFSLTQLDIIGLLFQTGYLTIQFKQTRHNRSRYTLGYPNEEVRISMMYNLTEAFTYKTSSVVGQVLVKMQDGLEEGKIDVFIEQLNILLSDISYHLLPRKKNNKQTEFEQWEGYFHTIIYLVTSFMDLQVQSEITKHKGRLDLLVESEEHLYLMEFKLNEPIENAIAQIKNRDYAAAYRNSPKTVHLVGITFSQSERNVSDWQAEIWRR